MFVAQVGFSEQSEVYTATGGPKNLGENALIPWGSPNLLPVMAALKKQAIEVKTPKI